MPAITIAKNQKQKVEIGSVDGAGNRTNDPVSGPTVTSGDPSKLVVDMTDTTAIRLVPQSGAAAGDTVTVSFSASVTVNGSQVSFSNTVTVTVTAEVPPPDPTAGIDLFPVGEPEFQ